MTTPTPVITGVVRDGVGDPVAAARVYLVDSPVPVPDIAALTGPDGAFTIGVPVPGCYTLEATAEGRPPAHATITTTPGLNRVELHLRG